MNRYFLPFLALLVGCDEHIDLKPKHQTTHEPAPEAPELKEGSYELQVLKVSTLQCQGMKPADLLGQELGLSLARTERGVELNLEGVFLHGPMKNGVLSAHGSDIIEADQSNAHPAEPDQGADAGEASAGSRGRVSSIEVDARVDLVILSDRMASGSFNYEVVSEDFDCTVAADVAVLFVGESDDGVVVEEDAPADNGEDEVSEGDSGAAEE